MRILFINTIDNVGGAALVGWNLGKKLLEQGHEVKYIVGFKKSKDRYVYQLKRKSSLHYLTNKTRIDFDFIYRGLLTKFFANDIDFGAKEELLNHPWYRKADIVHCNNMHGNYINLEVMKEMSRSKKVIWTLHDEWAIMAHGCSIIEDKVVGGFFRRSNLNLYPAMLWNNEEYLAKKKAAIYRQSEFNVVVPSRWLKDKVHQSIFAKRNTAVIHNGVDTDIFSIHDKTAARKQLELPLDKKIVLFVADSGKNNPLKGWSYTEKVINHFKDRDDILFLCIGGKPSDEKIKAKNVRYISYIAKDTLLSLYYSSSDVFLFTSLVESFGLVVIEAMACGLPVVAFPVGIVPEVIKHRKNGYISAYKDSDDLIRGVEYLFSLPPKALANQMAEFSQRAKKEYSLETMAARYLAAYKKLLNGQGHSS